MDLFGCSAFNFLGQTWRYICKAGCQFAFQVDIGSLGDHRRLEVVRASQRVEILHRDLVVWTFD